MTAEPNTDEEQQAEPWVLCDNCGVEYVGDEILNTEYGMICDDCLKILNPPPRTGQTIEQRVDKIAKILAEHYDDGDESTADLLADMSHFIADRRQDAEDIYIRAEMHFTEERSAAGLPEYNPQHT